MEEEFRRLLKRVTKLFKSPHDDNVKAPNKRVGDSVVNDDAYDGNIKRKRVQ